MLIVVILLVIALYVQREESYYVCGYRMLAQSGSDTAFTLYLPIPSNYTGTTYADIAAQALFTGDPTREIVDTIHGAALMISGTGRIGVEWSSSSRSVVNWGYFPCITMFDGSLNITTGMTETWVFSDDPDVSVYLEYHATTHRHVSPWFASGTSESYELLMPSGMVGWRPAITDHTGIVSN